MNQEGNRTRFGIVYYLLYYVLPKFYFGILFNYSNNNYNIKLPLFIYLLFKILIIF